MIEAGAWECGREIGGGRCSATGRGAGGQIILSGGKVIRGCGCFVDAAEDADDRNHDQGQDAQPSDEHNLGVFRRGSLNRGDGNRPTRVR